MTDYRFRAFVSKRKSPEDGSGLLDGEIEGGWGIGARPSETSTQVTVLSSSGAGGDTGPFEGPFSNQIGYNHIPNQPLSSKLTGAG